MRAGQRSPREHPAVKCSNCTVQGLIRPREEFPRLCPHLCHQLQVVDIVLLGDNELVDVALPLPLGGGQHVQQVQVCTPCKTQQHPRLYFGSLHRDSHLWQLQPHRMGRNCLLLWSQLLFTWHSPVMLRLSEALNIPFNTFFSFIQTKAISTCELFPGGQV